MLMKCSHLLWISDIFSITTAHNQVCKLNPNPFFIGSYLGNDIYHQPNCICVWLVVSFCDWATEIPTPLVYYKIIISENLKVVNIHLIFIYIQVFQFGKYDILFNHCINFDCILIVCIQKYIYQICPNMSVQNAN